MPAITHCEIPAIAFGCSTLRSRMVADAELSARR